MLKALQAREDRDAVVVFGAMDAMKLRSPLTLFEAAHSCSLLAEALKGCLTVNVTKRCFTCSPEVGWAGLLARRSEQMDAAAFVTCLELDV